MDFKNIIPLNLLSVKYFIQYIEYNRGMKVFGERLVELRKEKKISQAKLAKSLGVSYSVVCYWETDRSEPTAPNIVKIAEFFNVTTDYLLGRSDF